MESLFRQPALVAAILTAAIAAATDAWTRRIPNPLVAAGAAAGLLLSFWSAGRAGLLRSGAGMLVGFCVFLPFFLLRGMGGGDVKLMAALGACLGPLAILQAAFVASIVGAVMALAFAAQRGAVGRTLAGAGRLLGRWVTRGPRYSPELSLDNPQALKIPYALPIAAGAMFIVFSA